MTHPPGVPQPAPAPSPGGPSGPGRLDPSVLAVLDRITDPTLRVLADCQDAMAQLRSTVRRLKLAKNKDGDCLGSLKYEVLELDEQLDRLAELIEEKRQ